MAAVMMETATIDEKIAEMGHAIAKLTKTVEEKDLQIATLMNKLKVQTSQDAHTSSPKKAGGPQGSSTSISSLSVQQLQYMITNTI